LHPKQRVYENEHKHQKSDIKKGGCRPLNHNDNYLHTFERTQ
jgi:hypothetical protein